MESYKAIPKGYMTVGQLARRVGVTVRTLQHYDKEGFFSPSAQSEGGRRLYSDKDLIRLHQILSLKQLGFSLEDIKNRVIPLDTPEDVAKILTEQAADIKMKIQNLQKSYKAIELLKDEVLQMNHVDFNKYADIIVNLQMRNDYYFLIKYFDDGILDSIRGRFNVESGLIFMKEFNIINDEIIRLQEENIAPNSEEAQALAKDFWEMIMDFTCGDMDMMAGLIEFSSKIEDSSGQGKKLAIANEYISKALSVYLEKLGIDAPGEELK